MTKRSSNEIMQAALAAETAVLAFNIPYLPMMGAVVEALRDTRTFGLITVARLEWVKFESGSMAAIHNEYERVKDERFTRLHLDHCPVIDEDDLAVEYLEETTRAVELGYESVMVDGSRLPLRENIAATRRVVDMAHASGIPVEAELGAVLGHEAGPLPPYEELFSTGRGFTDVDEAVRFVRETQVDWLSVAVGNIHGAISAAKKNETKLAARLDIDHLKRIRQATGVPLVLHGGTGIRREYVLDAIASGIAKINVATAIRQPYERLREESVEKAQRAVYEAVRTLVRDELDLAGNVDMINPVL
ncbi:MAG: class II fructose-bisphosphate aldolase [Lentisphaeria bacterium]|nr:class II fructose-bisphosphate aldolase [Lentisphaeria bacterium]